MARPLTADDETDRGKETRRWPDMRVVGNLKTSGSAPHVADALASRTAQIEEEEETLKDTKDRASLYNQILSDYKDHRRR